MSLYTATGRTLKRNSNGYKMLQLIIKNDGATKYECLTEALGLKGTKRDLRGYYSCYFKGWVNNGVVSYDPKTYEYKITSKGAHLFLQAHERA